MNFTKKPLDNKFCKITDEGLRVQNALYEFNPGKCLLPGIFDHYIQQIWDAPVRKDDVWLVSYPRTGATWCQEMIWLIGNNLNFNEASTTLQQRRAPIIESSVILYEYAEQLSNIFTNSVDYVNKLPSQRFIRSHLPFQLLPTEIHKVKPKIIYTMRHPKDLCVSYYFYSKLFHGFDVEFETFCELFLNDSTAYGGLFNHYREFWSRRHDDNILILKYEDMKKDTRSMVKTVSRFMEKTLSDEEVDSLSEFLQFNKMKDNSGCNCESILYHKFTREGSARPKYNLLRKGEVGDWQNYMSAEISEKFDKWIEKNTSGTDLLFN